MVEYLSGGRIQGEKAHKIAYTGATDGSDTVLIFTESGTFTPAETFDVEYLVVGAGGSGGFWLGGGGGAGAYRISTSNAKNHEVTAQTYTITVGAGGNGGLTQVDAKNPDGGSSIFDNITSEGGGSGGSHTGGSAGSSAGSGGGASDNVSAGTGGSFGNNGGTGTNNGDTNDTGGGGGGSYGSSAGGNGTNQGAAGAGGAGIENDISGSSLYYAAGGGGGSGTHSGNSGGVGGSSIGGDGGGNTEDEDGDNAPLRTMGGVTTAGTGSGGGGGAHGDFNNNGRAGYGGKGSAGIVIIRFVTSGNSFTATRGTVDEKIAITDVPAGTRYEETDTKIIYRRKAGVAVGLGTAANGTNNGAARATNSAGANLGAYSADFDGDSDYVLSGLTQNLGRQFSFAFWVQIGSLASWGDIMGKGSADNSEEFVAYMHSSGTFYAISGECFDDVNLRSDVRPRTQRWYHVVYTCDGTGEYKTYVNGEYVSNQAKPDVAAATSTTEALKIGTTRMGGFFDGRISQTLVYNDILTQAEVTALYNGGDGVAAPNGNGLLVWYDFQEASGAILNKQSTTAIPDGDWVEKGTA